MWALKYSVYGRTDAETSHGRSGSGSCSANRASRREGRGESWHNIGKRMSVFEKRLPTRFMCPHSNRTKSRLLPKWSWRYAPGKDSHQARLIAPEEVGVENRGSGSMSRLVHNILPEQKPADSLLVVEVFTDGGNWSSYPPHKHDRDERRRSRRWRKPTISGFSRNAVLPFSGSTPMTVRWTKRWRSKTARLLWCLRATIRYPRLPDMMCTT